MTHKVSAVVFDPHQAMSNPQYHSERFDFYVKSWHEAFNELSKLWLAKYPLRAKLEGTDHLEIWCMSMICID